jgi:hypothetical protein
MDRPALLALARAGDEVALAALRADLSPATVATLAAVLLPGDPAPDLLRTLTAARSPDVAPLPLEAVVVALLEDEHGTPAAVAELLDRPVAEVEVVRAATFSRAGRPARPVDCRGWVLVARRDSVGAAEQAAAVAHLTACRTCREAAGAVRDSLRPSAALVADAHRRDAAVGGA